MDMEGTQNTLRDTILNAVETVQADEPQASEPTQTTSERVRDEAGKFAKAPEAKEVQATEPIKAEPAEVVPRPSTWKKDYWDKFDALDPSLKQYINQRETEYKTGVSTYKAEAEQARALNEAITPFLPALQQNGIQPTEWIKNLGAAHQTLVYGSPQQKAQMFAKLAQDYGIDLNGLGNQSQVQQDPQAEWLTQQLNQLRSKFDSLEQQKQAQEQAELVNHIQQFQQDTERYPHFEQVREPMAGLLQAGLATDLPSAYEKALRLHDDLWQQEQEAKAKALEAERLKASTQAAAQARSRTVSPKSVSPSGQVSSGGGKGLRDTLAEAVNQHLGARV